MKFTGLSCRWLMLCLSGALLAACGIFGGDKPADPPAELTDFKQAFTVKSLWNVKIGDKSENLHLGLMPATDNARIYAATNDGNIIAVDAVSGKTYWKKDLELPFSAGPGIGEGLLAIGTGDGDVLLLSTVNGDVLWHVELSGEVLAVPAIAGDKIIVRTVDGLLHGLSATNGQELWAIEREVPRLSLRGNSSPVVIDNLVVCGFDDGRVMAVEIEDGATVWDTLIQASTGKTEIERLVDVDAQVLALGADIYTTSYQGKVAMLALESGQSWWEKDMSSFLPITTDGNNLYLVDAKSHVWGLARRNGQVLWEQDALHQRQLTAAVVYGPAVVAGDFEGYLHWLDRGDGKLVARNRVNKDRISAKPLVLDNVLYVQSDSGRLYAYRANIKAREN